MIDASAIYTGICVNNADPEGRYRITAICPQVFGNDTTETDWALPVIPPGWTAPSALVQPHRTVSLYTAGGTGTATIEMPHVLDFPTPNPGVGVWLAFQGGDIEYPLWLGVWA